MRGILVVAHGTKNIEESEMFLQHVDMIAKKYDDSMVEYHITKLTTVSIVDKLTTLAEAGCSEILVVPYLLFAAGRFASRVNEQIENFRATNDTKIYITSSIGDSRLMVDILTEVIENKDGGYDI